MFADYHVHTEFSDDSVYPIEQVVKDAIAMGMTELCFTDHVDYGIKEDWDCGRPIAYRGDVPFANVDYLTDIFRQVIADGKGIELSTSYHRYRLSDTTPSMDILKLYRQLGGEIVTIGSDSHAPEHLGAYIAEGKELLKELGFRYFCTYDKMQPKFFPL